MATRSASATARRLRSVLRPGAADPRPGGSGCETPWETQAVSHGRRRSPLEHRRSYRSGGDTMTDATVAPIVEFFQLVPNVRPPQRADRAVGGMIPARALRYCEAMTSASA